MKNTLEKLRTANTERAKQFGRIEDWTLTDWACAVNGEAGELANKCIHALRGDAVYQSEIADEAADIVIYLDLFCQRAGINLEDSIIDKFNKTSNKKNSKILIDAIPECKSNSNAPYIDRDKAIVVATKEYERCWDEGNESENVKHTTIIRMVDAIISSGTFREPLTFEVEELKSKLFEFREKRLDYSDIISCVSRWFCRHKRKYPQYSKWYCPDCEQLLDK